MTTLNQKEKVVLPKIKKDPCGYEKLESMKPSAADELRITLQKIAVTPSRLMDPKKAAL